MARFELAASWSQTKRTTNCTTSRNYLTGASKGNRTLIFCLEGRHNSHYTTPAFGVPAEIRTPDTVIKSHVLYLLSYGHIYCCNSYCLT